MVNEFFQQFSVCYVSASILHSLECPLIPCLIVLGLFIFQNPWLFRCQLFLGSLTSPSGSLLIYFQNTSACLACTEVPYVSVCFTRLYGQCFVVLVLDSFMLSPFPVIAFNNIGSSEPNGIPHSVVPLCFVANPCWCLD